MTADEWMARYKNRPSRAQRLRKRVLALAPFQLGLLDVTRRLDLAAKRALSEKSKKKRREEESHRNAEEHAMATAEVWSWAAEALDGRRRARSQSLTAANRSEPRFANGESVLQWWAPWFATAQSPPTTYKEKHRPAWYMGEILAYRGLGTMVHAGVQHRFTHFYYTF